ncbi:contractile injection system tape measure protein [Pseudomonas aeruginosa]|uniref:contractile injection system tape measure protein n=1 Tax=Pseudomonas aeruginosa TaxID=287 RepID=UPI002ADD80EA|nr:contractile injection system tape measure protein [Pseudomonas aeruginosa]MEA0988978.1 contractile injection system tape measure protein [Pseudomonas aeruginosa]
MEGEVDIISLELLRLRLHCQDRQAVPLQNRASAWFHTRLQRELSALLTQYAAVGTVSRSIERLSVVVGDVRLSRFEAEMSAQVVAQLKRQLDTYYWAAETVTSALEYKPEANIHADIDSTAPLDHVPLATFTQLLRYLDTGVVGDARLWTGREARDAWLMSALEGASQALVGVENVPARVALALRVLQPRARQRLLSTWPRLGVTGVSEWLMAPTRSPMLSTTEGTDFLPLVALIVLQRHPEAASAYERALSAVYPTSQQNERLAAQIDEVWGSQPSTDMHSALATGPLSQGAWSAVNSMAASSSLRPSEAAGKEDSPTLPDSALGTWLEMLLRSPLPTALRAQLQAWLLDPVRVNQLLPRVGQLPVPLRQRLRAVLGVPSQQPVPPLNSVPQVVAAESFEADARAAAHAHPLRAGEMGASDAIRASAMLGERSAPARFQLVGESEEPWVVASAGLVLLWPLLPRLFSGFGWLEDGRFIDEQVRWQALACLDWLAWGDEEVAEWRTPCARLLCGIDWEDEFQAQPPTVARQRELDEWLGQVFAAVPTLNRCGVGDLRAFFLQRPGTLSEERRLLLTIESDASDVLLHSLPWPLTQVMLPWLPIPLGVDWTS